MGRLDRLPSQTSEWLRGSGPHGEIVISSRVRLARNLAGYPFVNRSDRRQRLEVLTRVRQEILNACPEEQLFWIDLLDTAELDRMLLVERHLISRQHAATSNDFPRSVVIGAGETFAIMVNEEDHLRLQVLRSGLQLSEAFEQINQLDDALEQHLDFAYGSKWGYLTACPTNVGTGIRVSVMLHLPALKITGEIDKVKRAARDMHLAVRGLFGEGSDALGDLYQISNQTTLGRSEEEILADFQNNMVPQIIAYEQQARLAMLRQHADALDDRIWRAWAILTHARLSTGEEALQLLSHLRLGVNLGRIDTIDIPAINELFLLTQPAHLQKLAGRALDKDERRQARAQLIRERLEASR